MVSMHIFNDMMQLKMMRFVVLTASLQNPLMGESQTHPIAASFGYSRASGPLKSLVVGALTPAYIFLFRIAFICIKICKNSNRFSSNHS